MAYDPGALTASLASAVGSDHDLVRELRGAFLESAGRFIDLMSRARCDANWNLAASRLEGLAGSFGVENMLRLAEEALDGAPGDPVVLRQLRAALNEFAEA